MQVERKIRFVTAPSEYDLEREEWDDLKGYLYLDNIEIIGFYFLFQVYLLIKYLLVRNSKSQIPVT